MIILLGGFILKKIALLFILCTILLLICFSATAFADGEPIQVTFEQDNTSYTFEWGSHPYEINYELERDIEETTLPFWAEPTQLTDVNMGFTAELDTYRNFANLGSINEFDLALYYAYKTDEYGFNTDINSSQLYMAEASLYRCSKEQLDSIITQYSEKYDEPAYNERERKAGISYNNGLIEPILWSEQIYSWEASDNTGIKLITHYAQDWDTYFTHIYHAKTDYDATLLEGKLSTDHPYITTTYLGSIEPLYDEYGNQLGNIDYGTTVLITGYDSARDMFKAIVKIDTITTEYSSYGPITSTSTSGYSENKKGFVTGNQLSICKDELINAFNSGVDYAHSGTPSSQSSNELNIAPGQNNMPVMKGTSLSNVLRAAEAFGLTRPFSDENYGHGTYRCSLQSPSGGLTLDLIYSSSTSEILCGRVVTFNYLSTTEEQAEFIRYISAAICPETDVYEVTTWVASNIGNSTSKTIGDFEYEVDLGPANNLLYYAGISNWEKWELSQY